MCNSITALEVGKIKYCDHSIPTVLRDSRHDSLLSMGKSSTLLAQIFSLLIRQLAETLDNIYEVSNCPTPPYVLPALGTDPADLYKFVWAELEEVWVWLFNSMDMLESQLRFGSSVSRKVIPCVSLIKFNCYYFVQLYS